MSGPAVDVSAALQGQQSVCALSARPRRAKRDEKGTMDAEFWDALDQVTFTIAIHIYLSIVIQRRREATSRSLMIRIRYAVNTQLCCLALSTIYRLIASKLNALSHSSVHSCLKCKFILKVQCDASTERVRSV